MKISSELIFYILFLIFLAYFLLLIFYYFILGIIALFEERRRAWEDSTEDYTSLSASSFTMPVSVIIPAHNEEDWIADCLQSVLNLKYPEFEVIVVDDGSTDKTLAILDSKLKLQPIDKVYVERFKSGEIREIFKSMADARVTVINKVGGYKKAGAVNAGLNLAKYKYVCVMDADTVLEPDSLLRVMAHVQKDPDHIIGIGGYFGLANGFKIKDGRILERNFCQSPLITYQSLEYLRSFIINRTAWSKFNAMPNVAGGFGVWRRDILLELGGYAVDFSSEDIEFTFRAHDYIIENKKEGDKIIMLPYYVGWTEGPATIKSYILQRDRWQRVINETIWKYRHMILSPKHKIFAFLTLPYYLFYEVLGVFFEIASVALVIWGFLAGVLTVKTFLAYFTLMILLQALVSLLAIFAFNRDQKLFRLRDITYFIILSFMEFFWYKWLMSFAKCSGTLNYFRGVRIYDKYERVKRV